MIFQNKKDFVSLIRKIVYQFLKMILTCLFQIVRSMFLLMEHIDMHQNIFC